MVLISNTKKIYLTNYRPLASRNSLAWILVEELNSYTRARELLMSIEEEDYQRVEKLWNNYLGLKSITLILR
jgi:hypothetical protein